MSQRSTRAARPDKSIVRIGGIGLALGAAIPVPTAALALMWGPAEFAKLVLVPGAELLSALAGYLEQWPAPISLALVSGVNGVVYAVGAMALAGLRRTLLRHYGGDR